MMQLSLFTEDANFYAAPVPSHSQQQTDYQAGTVSGQQTGKVINFHTAVQNYAIRNHETTKEKSIVRNRVSGKAQKVYPIKRYDELLAMANWLYQNKDPKYVLAFVIGINVGLRANELLQIRMNEVFNPDGTVRFYEDMENTSDRIVIHQSKVDKNRPIFLNRACKDALEWYFPVRGCGLYSSKYLFPSREGGAIEVDTFRKVLKEAARANGISQNIGTHTLRKTFAHAVYGMMKSGELVIHADISFLQMMMGHSDPNITRLYADVEEEDFKLTYHKLQLNLVQDQAFLGHGNFLLRQ